MSALLLKSRAIEDYVFPVLCVVVACWAGGAVCFGEFMKPLSHGASVGPGPCVGGERASWIQLQRLGTRLQFSEVIEVGRLEPLYIIPGV